jgi:hypothetical protein
MGVTRTRRGGGGQVTSGLCGTTRTSGSACARCALLRGVPRALGLRARVDTRRPPSPAPRPPRFVEPSRAEPSRAESGRVGSGRVGPSRVVLTCRRWLLTRCMLSAGLLGRILPQPRTVHRILIRTPGTARLLTAGSAPGPAAPGPRAAALTPWVAGGYLSAGVLEVPMAPRRRRQLPSRPP